MRTLHTADSVTIDADEWGYVMLVDTDEGDHMVIRLPGTIAKRLAFEETLGIRLHWEEAAG